MKERREREREEKREEKREGEREMAELISMYDDDARFDGAS